LESITPTVNVEPPLPVGVPVMAPVEEFSDRPAGSEPDVIEYVYEPVPPVAVTV
jgi:hypothetical protein